MLRRGSVPPAPTNLKKIIIPREFHKVYFKGIEDVYSKNRKL